MVIFRSAGPRAPVVDRYLEVVADVNDLEERR